MGVGVRLVTGDGWGVADGVGGNRWRVGGVVVGDRGLGQKLECAFSISSSRFILKVIASSFLSKCQVHSWNFLGLHFFTDATEKLEIHAGLTSPQLGSQPCELDPFTRTVRGMRNRKGTF